MNIDYLQLFQQMPCGAIVTDGQGRIETANPLAISLLGMDDSESTCTIDKLLSKMNFNSESIPFSEASEKPISGEIHLLNRVLRFTGGPFTIGSSTGIRAIILIEDVTTLEARIQEAKKRERNDVLGEFSADIAHEFRNPLGSIELLSSLLRKELKRKKDIKRAEQILAAVKNMENKISSLIQFSKIYQTPVRLVNLHHILGDLLCFPDLDGGLPFISAHLSDCEPLVECNSDMMKQVFITLILNALQSLTESSRLEISTCPLPDKQQIEVKFTERTTGSTDAIRATALDRFAQGRENNWGLGLAIIHNIINMYHGSLRLEYLHHIGTSIVLSFPLANSTISLKPTVL